MTSLMDPVLSRLRIDSNASEPYHLQVRRQIEELVRSGELLVGTSLPSERDLAEALGISRTTIKRSYDDLRRAQMLFSKGRRSGTVVQGTSLVSPVLHETKGFTEEMQDLGRAPSTRVLERAVVTDRTVASMFNRPSDNPFLRLVRLRLADELPIAREVVWYDLSMAPKLADWPGDTPAYDFLREHCGLPLVWAEQSIEAVTSSGEETQALGLAAPSPCLLIKRLTHAANDKPMEYVEGVFRGDAYRYQIKSWAMKSRSKRR